MQFGIRLLNERRLRINKQDLTLLYKILHAYVIDNALITITDAINARLQWQIEIKFFVDIK